MPVYMVGYDLKAGQNYANLIEHIKTYGTWWHHLDSTWFIVSDLSAALIYDNAWQHMYTNDKLIVVKVTAPGAWRGISEGGSNWLKKYLEPRCQGIQHLSQRIFPLRCVFWRQGQIREEKGIRVVVDIAGVRAAIHRTILPPSDA